MSSAEELMLTQHINNNTSDTYFDKITNFTREKYDKLRFDTSDATSTNADEFKLTDFVNDRVTSCSVGNGEELRR